MAEHQDNRRNLAVVPGATAILPQPLQAAAMRAADQPYGTAITAKEWQISEARSCLPAWREKLRPASDKHRIAILIALSDVVAKPDVLRNGNTAAQSLFWQAYHADLGHLPAIVLSRACAAWRRSGEAWFPTSGQLLKLARGDDAWRDDVAAVKGLERLAKAWVTDPREETAEEREAMLRQSEEFRARLREAVKSERSETDADNQAALDHYRGPRPWDAKPARQGRAA
jgi:hypothetical protein